jgi:uncharacterized membrane protein YdjX (TVP38/TMEM64 family)
VPGYRPVRWLIWLAVAAILAGFVGACIAWWRPVYEFVADQNRISTWVSSLGVWGPLAIVALEIGQVLLAPIPGQAIQVVSGYLYGPWLGTLYSLLGVGLGSVVSFLLARRLGRPLAVRLIGSQATARLDGLVRKGGTLFFFLIWLLPFAPDDLACLAAGLTPMSLSQFLVLVMIGRMPGVIVSVWLGAYALQINPLLFGLLLAVLTLAAVILWWRAGQIRAAVLRLVERLSEWRSGS